MNEFLKQLGIDKRGFKVYKILLQLGPSSIRQIAERSGVNRGTTHELLKMLITKGLVSYRLQGKRRHYLAEHPEKLIQIINEKKTSLRKISKALVNNIVPTLNTQKFIYTKPTVRFYDREEGIEQVLKDVLLTVGNQKDKQYFAFSAQPIRKYLYRVYPNFTKHRIKKKIKVNVIALGKGGEEALLSERKWLPEINKQSIPSYIIIYVDKLALISIAKEELPYAVVIEEQGLTQSMKLIFTTLWKVI